MQWNQDLCSDSIEVSVVMPCLNEALTLQTCIVKAQNCFDRCGFVGEIIVADNGSSDGSQQLAADLGARVVSVATRGYGAALQAGIAAARGRFVIMGDADNSYDFSRLENFVQALRQGHDLVMGNRFRGGIKPGAMPWLHRYLGNPGLTLLARLLFRVPCRDVYCGLRGFRRDIIPRLDLRSTGMEFALEMLVKATLHDLRICEVPTILSPDGRDRAPHLKTWKDGRRSLRFYLCCAPNWLFLAPALMLLFACLSLLAAAWLQRASSSEFTLFALLLFAGSTGMVAVQALFFAVLARISAIAMHLLPSDLRFRKLLRRCRLEHALAGAALLFAGGSVIVGQSFALAAAGGETLPLLQRLLPGTALLTLAAQLGFFSVYFSLAKGCLRQLSSASVGNYETTIPTVPALASPANSVVSD